MDAHEVEETLDMLEPKGPRQLTSAEVELGRLALVLDHQRRHDEELHGEMLTVQQTWLKHYLEQRVLDMQTIGYTAFEPNSKESDAFWLQYKGDPDTRRRLPVLKDDPWALAARVGRRLAETEQMVHAMEDEATYALREHVDVLDRGHVVDWQGYADVRNTRSLANDVQRFDMTLAQTVFDPYYPEAQVQRDEASQTMDTELDTVRAEELSDDDDDEPIESLHATSLGVRVGDEIKLGDLVDINPNNRQAIADVLSHQQPVVIVPVNEEGDHTGIFTRIRKIHTDWTMGKDLAIDMIRQQTAQRMEELQALPRPWAQQALWQLAAPGQPALDVCASWLTVLDRPRIGWAMPVADGQPRIAPMINKVKSDKQYDGDIAFWRPPGTLGLPFIIDNVPPLPPPQERYAFVFARRLALAGDEHYLEKFKFLMLFYASISGPFGPRGDWSQSSREKILIDLAGVTAYAESDNGLVVDMANDDDLAIYLALGFSQLTDYNGITPELLDQRFFGPGAVEPGVNEPSFYFAHGYAPVAGTDAALKEFARNNKLDTFYASQLMPRTNTPAAIDMVKIWRMRYPKTGLTQPGWRTALSYAPGMALAWLFTKAGLVMDSHPRLYSTWSAAAALVPQMVAAIPILGPYIGGMVGTVVHHMVPLNFAAAPRGPGQAGGAWAETYGDTSRMAQYPLATNVDTLRDQFITEAMRRSLDMGAGPKEEFKQMIVGMGKDVSSHFSDFFLGKSTTPFWEGLAGVHAKAKQYTPAQASRSATMQAQYDQWTRAEFQILSFLHKHDVFNSRLSPDLAAQLQQLVHPSTPSLFTDIGTESRSVAHQPPLLTGSLPGFTGLQLTDRVTGVAIEYGATTPTADINITGTLYGNMTISQAALEFPSALAGNAGLHFQLLDLVDASTISEGRQSLLDVVKGWSRGDLRRAWTVLKTAWPEATRNVTGDQWAVTRWYNSIASTVNAAMGVWTPPDDVYGKAMVKVYTNVTAEVPVTGPLMHAIDGQPVTNIGFQSVVVLEQLIYASTMFVGFAAAIWTPVAHVWVTRRTVRGNARYVPDAFDERPGHGAYFPRLAIRAIMENKELGLFNVGASYLGGQILASCFSLGSPFLYYYTAVVGTVGWWVALTWQGVHVTRLRQTELLTAQRDDLLAGASPNLKWNSFFYWALSLAPVFWLIDPWSVTYTSGALIQRAVLVLTQNLIEWTTFGNYTTSIIMMILRGVFMFMALPSTFLSGALVNLLTGSNLGLDLAWSFAGFNVAQVDALFLSSVRLATGTEATGDLVSAALTWFMRPVLTTLLIVRNYMGDTSNPTNGLVSMVFCMVIGKIALDLIPWLLRNLVPGGRVILRAWRALVTTPARVVGSMLQLVPYAGRIMSALTRSSMAILWEGMTTFMPLGGPLGQNVVTIYRTIARAWKNYWLRGTLGVLMNDNERWTLRVMTIARSVDLVGGIPAAELIKRNKEAADRKKYQEPPTLPLTTPVLLGPMVGAVNVPVPRMLLAPMPEDNVLNLTDVQRDTFASWHVPVDELNEPNGRRLQLTVQPAVQGADNDVRAARAVLSIEDVT